MVRAKRDTSKKRESIVDAATRAFRDEGYEATSMDLIAELAGASKRTVYNHFPSKQALFQAVIDKAMGQMLALKKVKYDPERTLEEQLEQFANAKLQSVQDPSWLSLTKVVLSVFIRDPELARDTISRAMADEDALVVWLKAAMADGRIVADDPELAASLFWATMTGAFIWPMVFTGPLDERAVPILKKEIIGLFLSRYGAEDEP